MNNKKIRVHFQFNFKERIAFLMILFVVAITFAYPYLFIREAQPLTIIKSPAANNNKQEYNKGNDGAYQPQSYSSYKGPQRNAELFYFDPNTATAAQWERLGLRDRTIRTISNYVSKGGSFKKKEDLQKIYGLHPDEYERLAPYVKIAFSEKMTPDAKDNFHQTNSNRVYAKPLKKTEAFTINDINTADASALIALPGIGEKLATRIINFRDKLGGFYTVDQVRETYALPDSTFQLIRPHLKLNSSVKKININTASKDELRLHPYIRWHIANAIVEYRNQHGTFKTLEDLKNIVVIDDATFKKIQPYLSL